MTTITVNDERDNVVELRDLCPGDFFYINDPENMKLLTGMDSINAEVFDLVNLTKQILPTDEVVCKYKEITIDATL